MRCHSFELYGFGRLNIPMMKSLEKGGVDPLQDGRGIGLKSVGQLEENLQSKKH